jgi:hypothetical protein
MLKSWIAGVIVWSLTAAASAAPAVQLSIQDGRVWLKADKAGVADILREWARVGRTVVVDGDRVPGGPLSLQLEGVPEQQALDIVLRGVSGFVAVARPETIADATASRFERIVVLPTAAAPNAAVASAPAPPVFAPAPTPVVAAPIFTASGAQRVLGPDGQPVPDDQEDAPPPRVTPNSIPPGFSPPPEAPPQNGPGQPSATPQAPAGTPRPGVITPPPTRRPGGA